MRLTVSFSANNSSSRRNTNRHVGHHQRYVVMGVFANWQTYLIDHSKSAIRVLPSFCCQ